MGKARIRYRPWFCMTVFCSLILASGILVYMVLADWTQQTKLTASDGAGGDYFGGRVSVSGNYAIAGAVGDDDHGDLSGSAYIYKNTGSWGQLVKLVPADGASWDVFGRSVGISGDYAVVGAEYANSFKGAAYIHYKDQGGTDAWGQQAKITASDGASSDSFGFSSAISGDYAIVGAWGDDSGAGSAYIFKRSGTNWSQLVKLTASDRASGDYFGYGVSISGDYAVVGAYDDDDDGTDSGSAYLFYKDQGGTDAWGQVKKVRPTDGSASTHFGMDVGISGTTVIAGTYAWSPSSNHSAYIFYKDQGGTDAWGQVKKINIGSYTHNTFGNGVAVSGDLAIVGNDEEGTSAGNAYIFSKDTGGADNWGQVNQVTPSDGAGNDRFGTGVAISSAYAFAGSPQHNSSAGAVYVYIPPNTAPSVDSITAASRTDGTGTVDISVNVSDTDGNGVKVKVEYAAEGGNNTCDVSDFSSPLDPTLDETASNVTASVGAKPDVENDNTYQIGTNTSITTSSTNTVTFDWSSATELPTANADYCLRFTPNDGTTDGSAAYSSEFTLDNAAPTASGNLTFNSASASSITFNLGVAGSDTHLNNYKIYYKTGASGVTTSDSLHATIASGSYNQGNTTQIGSLSANAQYVANIWTYDSYGKSAAATEISAYTAAAVPDAPTVNGATASSLNVTVNANGNPGATAFAIQESGSGNYVQADGSLSGSAVWRTASAWGTVTVSVLSSNTAYQFKVKAKNADGMETAFSSANTAVYTYANTVLGASATDATDASTLRLQLIWTNQGQSGMKIERDTSCDGSWDATVFDDTDANETSPLIITSGISPNTCYQFRIGSYNGGGVINTSYATAPQVTTPPGQPQSLTAASAAESSITWSWAAVTGAAGYNVYNASDQQVGTVDAPTTQYTQTDLLVNTLYTVYVRARNANGTGVKSSNASGLTSVAAPSGLSHSSQSASSITWTWASGGQSAFYAQDKNNVSVNSGWITGTSWEMNGLLPNTSYTLQVKGRNAGLAESAFTEITRHTSQNTPSGVTFGTVGADSVVVNAAGTFPNLGNGSSVLHFSNGTVTQDVASGNSWTNTELSPNTQYTYTVYATNGDGDQTSSVNASKYTLATAPTAPAVGTKTSSTFALTIPANGNPAGTLYVLCRTADGASCADGGYVQTNGNLGSSASWNTFANGVTVTGLLPDTTYRFIAKAINGEDMTTSFSSASTVAATLASIPGTPTVNGATAASLDVTISTNGNPSGTYYVISVLEGIILKYVQANGALGSSPVWQTAAEWGAQSGTNGKIQVTGLIQSTNYIVSVIAKNTDGTETFESEPSVLSTLSSGSTQHSGGSQSNGNGNGNGNGTGGSSETPAPPATPPTTSDTTLKQILQEFGDKTEPPKTTQREMSSFKSLGEIFSFLTETRKAADGGSLKAKDYLDFNGDGKFDILDLLRFLKKK